MADIPDPNGTLCRAAWMGKATVSAGAISTTVNAPVPHDYFFVDLWPTWPAGGYEASRTGKAVVISWTMPAPVGGGLLRWKITV